MLDSLLCKLVCGKQIMDKHGVRHVHVSTTGFGIEKSKTAVTAEVVDNGAEKVRTLICEKLKPID